MKAMLMEVIDSHIHWGPSITMGIEVTTEEILRQADECGVQRMVIFPFPSTAFADESIHHRLLKEAERTGRFLPYYCIPEDLRPVPVGKGFYGGKWHWVRGVQDGASNYQVLDDPRLGEYIEASEAIGLPIVLEEELAFTETFVKMTKTLMVIIPHLGMLGGNPVDFLKAFGARENIYFDTALSSTETMMKFVEKVGPERVLFGSDIPFSTMKRELEKVLSLPIGEASKDLILHKNLERLIERG